MTPAQREGRAFLERTLGRPDPKAVEHGVLELLRTVIRQMPARGCLGPEGGDGQPSISLHSDDHPAYRRALRRLRRTTPGPVIDHQVTPSTDPRTCANPLFPVNLADLLLRHCGANHRRETIAFSKRRQAAIERLAVFTVWRNCIKSRREKQPGETAAMRAGVLDRRLGWEEVFRRRLFPCRSLLPGVWWSYYWRRVRTLALGNRQSEHRLRYAA
ncbi:MAG: hypothetical protein ABH877_05515 [bacterium]